MPKCASWRYRITPGHDECVPGACRDCWVPCREKVDVRGARCNPCVLALLSNPSRSIRTALLDEPDVSAEALSLLCEDQNPLIAMRAQQKLAAMQSEAPPAGDELASTVEASPFGSEAPDAEAFRARTNASAAKSKPKRKTTSRASRSNVRDAFPELPGEG